MHSAVPAHRLPPDPVPGPAARRRRLPPYRGGWQRVASRAASAALIVILVGVPAALAQDGAGGRNAGASEAARDHARPDASAQGRPTTERATSGPAASDQTGDGTPIISSDDGDVADAVMDGPSEPAGADLIGWDALPDADDLVPEALSRVLPDANQMFPSRSRGGRAMQRAPAATTATAAAAAGGSRAVSAQPASASPVVVELFTAQGCSSCPPADALLAELAARDDVLPLAFHVDYWDYLGWKDAFARPEFTVRQQAYGRRTGERAIYTPQMIVGGTDTLIDLSPAGLEALIDARRTAGSPVALSVEHSGGRIAITIGPGPVRTGPARVELIRYLPRREVRISAGENRGRVVAYRNIVVSVETLARWDGRAPLRLTVTPGAGGSQPLPADTRHTVLVQEEGRARSLGQVLAAVPFD